MVTVDVAGGCLHSTIRAVRSVTLPETSNMTGESCFGRGGPPAQ